MISARSPQAKVDACAERLSSSNERVKELEAKAKQLKSAAADAEATSKNSRVRHAELVGEIAKIAEQLSSSKAEQRESERERKAAEALENLSRLFPGVHGRMLDVCKPTARKYNGAVTIAMGKNMDAIVVESEATAHECVKYLKEKKCARHPCVIQ